jgi:uridine kinase
VGPANFRAPVSRVVELLVAAVPRAGRTRVLGIDGRSGAGKTSLSIAVRAAIEPAPQIVHVEDLYPGWDGLAEGAARLHDWVLQPLANGAPASYRRYDWERGEYGGTPIEVPAANLLIVEGVGAGSRDCAPYLAALVYLDAPEPIRFDRAMARDGETYRAHWRRWAVQEERLLADDDARGRADLVLDTQQPGVT